MGKAKKSRVFPEEKEGRGELQVTWSREGLVLKGQGA
jgi:hypothetical protein